MCETGVSWPSLATEQDKSETGVLSPGPSTNPTHPRSPTRDSWNNSWDRCDYRDKWTDVWKGGHDGNRWIHGWNEHYHGDNWTDAWGERNSVFVRQHNDDNSTDAWSKCKSDGEWHASHWETSSWSSSHWETSGWNDADECSDDCKGQLWSSHSFFETMNMDQLINSLCRSDDAATFSGIEVDPGESLADTAAPNGVIDVRPFRKAEEALFHKFGLKPRVIPGDNQAVGIGGRAKVLGKVEMPSGMGGVNGIVKYTVVDSPGVPPLTPVSLLKQVGAVIDLNSNTMDLKNIETTTTLRTLPSGHVAHKLTEFAPGGWKAPTMEQTELFQVRTDVFRPVTLPGEIKSRSSKLCVGFSSGFVYTVRDRSHLSLRLIINMIPTCVLTISCPLTSSSMINWLKERLVSSVHLFLVLTWMPTQRWGSCALVAEVRWRRLALRCLVHVTRVVADRAGLMATSILQNGSDRVYSFAGTPDPSRQSVGLNGCMRQKTWEMRRHHELFPLSCIDRSQRGKGQDERKEERGYHDQPKSRTDCRGCLYQGERRRCMSKVRPRTSCLQHRFRTDSTLSWMDSRRNTVYVDQSMSQRSHRPWRVAEYQPYRR